MADDYCRWKHPQEPCFWKHHLGRAGDGPVVLGKVTHANAMCAHVTELTLTCGHWYAVPRLTKAGNVERRMYIGITVLCGRDHGPDGMVRL